MGKGEGSSFGFMVILRGITAAGANREAMLRGFSGPGAPYLLLIKAVLTVRSAILIFQGNAATNVHTRKPNPE